MPTSKDSVLDEGRLRQLIDAGRGLVAELDPDVVFDRLLEAACAMTGARYAAIGILDSQRSELERFITRGVDEQKKREIGDLPRGRGVLGLLIADPKPLRLGDVGEHPRSYGFPPGHPPMKTFLGVPILIRGEAWGNLYLTEKQGGEFDERDEQVAVVLAEWTAIAVDNARLYHSSEEQRDALQQAVRGLEATTEIAKAVGGETDIDRILETVVKRARALVEARSLLILLEDHGHLRFAAAAGEAEFSDDLRMEIAGTAPGEVFQSGTPSRIRHLAPDLTSRPREGGEGAPAALLVPLTFRGQPVGVLVALDPLGEGNEFSGESERILASFAVSAATAVATAQTVAQDRLRKSIEAAELERGRWARELHDESLQSMAGVRVLLSQSLRDGADREALVERAIGQVDTTIAEMRRLIADLRPPALDELGLAAALEALVERLGGEAFDLALSVDLAHEGGRAPSRLSAATEDTIYRVVQEAVNNVVRHAEVEAASVTVSEQEDVVLVEVADHGLGFDPRQHAGGFGLRGMRERVELAGGTMSVQSVRGDGTKISVELPAERRLPDHPDQAALRISGNPQART